MAVSAGQAAWSRTIRAASLCHQSTLLCRAGPLAAVKQVSKPHEQQPTLPNASTMETPGAAPLPPRATCTARASAPVFA